MKPEEKDSGSDSLHELVRFDLFYCSYEMDEGSYMEECEDGEYVKFDDVKKLLSNDLNQVEQNNKETKS